MQIQTLESKYQKTPGFLMNVILKRILGTEPDAKAYMKLRTNLKALIYESARTHVCAFDDMHIQRYEDMNNLPN